MKAVNHPFEPDKTDWEENSWPYLLRTEITGSAKGLNVLRSVLGDLLAVTNAPTAVLCEGNVSGGRLKVQATVGY